ncbi:MAG: UDP-N-acetyl-D-glucosamine 2-epimerase, UDP-hydrolysing [Bacteroidetes bacterium GWA2_31_9]|nr:MAG: UDP-N-acetyl-D-glucosamine 2-epimerase, UDP-hydrolysing [Bacteroidetes bacterium GWA2_31_9]
MKPKIAFFTGARSEYGSLKHILRAIIKDNTFDYSLIVSGLHLLNQFGSTINEIKKDGFEIKYVIPIFDENISPSYLEFSNAVRDISKALLEEKPDGMFIIGDRIEAYAAALAAHFTNTKIIHSGGGTLTNGAVDNIYRYNITNLTSIHITTSLNNFNRLKTLPNVEKKNIHFVGSFAIDGIVNFKENKISIKKQFSKIIPNKFCLMTFHPVTSSKEDIALIMDKTIEYLIEKNFQILITYPNNDNGYQKIINIVDKWKNHQMITVTDNLGSQYYYSALDDCAFVIGNSSSGLLEAPYFHKQVINIGTRQDGRDTDVGVSNVSCDFEKVRLALELGFNSNWKKIPNNNIFGDGNTIPKIMKILKQNFK